MNLSLCGGARPGDASALSPGDNAGERPGDNDSSPDSAPDSADRIFIFFTSFILFIDWSPPIKKTYSNKLYIMKFGPEPISIIILLLYYSRSTRSLVI